MGEPVKLTDDDVLARVRADGGAATYVIRNRITLARGPGNPTTAQVLRALRRLERAGLVRQMPTSYAVMLSWALTDAGAARKAEVAHG